MARWLITSGPTREYLDPVRFLTNASSGRMGRALAQSLLHLGYEVVIVSGPVQLAYPSGCDVRPVVSTQEMLKESLRAYSDVEAVICAAAPSDYRPRVYSEQKLAKTGGPRTLELVETPDILAALGAQKGRRLLVGFALETRDHLSRAAEKMRRKNCDLMVVNGHGAIFSEETEIQVIDTTGNVVLQCRGAKEDVANQIVGIAIAAAGGGPID